MRYIDLQLVIIIPALRQVLLFLSSYDSVGCVHGAHSFDVKHLRTARGRDSYNHVTSVLITRLAIE